jgi:SAM-dependent methyltransferase
VSILKELEEVLAPGRNVRLVEDSIYSVFDDASRSHHYDRRATAYDWVVGTRAYNAVMWGASPADYIDFARQAVTSAAEGRFLDAGCGSMLFTASAFLDSDRPIIAFDQSLAMLRRARQRLIRLSGSAPDRILLMQADLSDLPFRPGSFRTVLCLNVLHQFDNARVLISGLSRLKNADGRLYLTSLVLNDRFIGDRYLRALYAAGEFVRPRSATELKDMFEEDQNISYSSKGSMAFISAY